MMSNWWILVIFDGIVFFFVALTVLYVLFFSIASVFHHKSEPLKSKRQLRFIILIPSYKQDKTIFHTVNSVLGQTYPQRLFDVVVISDHQSEMTNMQLAQCPITLLTPNFEHSTKAKSMQYALFNLPQFKIYDAILILDAGNVIEPEFLEQANTAFETAGTKAIQAHRMAKNRDTAIARLDTIFEEINNAIFRIGQNVVGFSAALNGSGMIYDFAWFKENIMKVRTAGEDKELEALLMRDHIYVDFIDYLHIYDEKTRTINDFNSQRGRWATTQFHALVSNIRNLPPAIFRRHYDYANKIVQWMLVPRTILVGIIMIMSIIWSFIYLSNAIKWWIAGATLMFAFAISTPDRLVNKDWDKDFLYAPFVILSGLVNIILVFVGELSIRINNGRKHLKRYLSKRH